MLKQKIAYVDLSTGTIRKELIPEKMRRMYLGGRGLDMYLLYNHVKPGIDALGPENALMISAGLLTGTPAPSSGRCHVGAKSPLTGMVGSTNMGGFFSPELRFAGFDHLVIKGQAKKPVYLWIHDGEIEIRDAAHLWGKDTFETPKVIREEHGDDEIKVLCIGLAGENLVRYANVRTGLKNSGGRTGMGAVMGSKKLKAVAVRGTQDVEIKYPERTLELCTALLKRFAKSKVIGAMSKYGTLMVYSTSNTAGQIRVRNFELNRLEEGEDLEPENMVKHSIGMAGCFSCPVHCRHKYIVPTGPHAGTYTEGPEYTTLGAFGTEVGCKSLETVPVGNYMANKYGIDTLEFGSMVSWAQELYEKEVIGEKETGGINLTWGNEEAVFQMLEQIVRREGLGDILAEGPVRAIEKLGEETGYYNIHIKGMSSLHSDERSVPSFAIGIGLATRGADHLRSRPALDLFNLPPDILNKVYGFPVASDYTSYEGKGKMIWWHERLFAVTDSVGLCKSTSIFFSPHLVGPEDYAGLINAITGMELSASDAMEIGERIYTIERMFNTREGATRKDDYLPERFYVEPTPLGLPINRGKTIDREKYDRALDENYQAHGWDSNGVPTEETLQRLGLDKEPSHIL